MRRILIIDDDELFLTTLERVLKSHNFEVKTALSGFAALDLVRSERFDLIISDVRMPGMDGIETLRKISDHAPATRKIVVTGFASDSAPIQAIKLGVDDYLNKPFQMEDFISSIHRSLERVEESLQQGDSRSHLQRKYHDLLRNIIFSFEQDAPYFNDHVRNVSSLAEKIGRAMGLAGERSEVVRLGAVLHDLGMFGIKESILEKASELSDEEKQRIRESPRVARELIQDIEGLRPVLPVIYHIHERIDGTGYPDGIAGSDIPLESRILAVAEAFVSLTSPRSYRDALERGEAIETIRSEQGQRFDPAVVTALLKVLEEDLENGPGTGQEEEEPEEWKNLDALLGLAYLYFRSGNLDLAESAARKALESAGTTTLPVLVRFLTLHSKIDLARGNSGEAIAKAQEALRRAKKMGDLLLTAHAFLHLGNAWIEAGKYGEADMAIGKAVESYDRWGDDFERIEAHLHQARLLFRQSAGSGASPAPCLSLLEKTLKSIIAIDARETIIDEGTLFVPLLMLALEQGLYPDYVKTLIALIMGRHPLETLHPCLEGSEIHQGLMAGILEMTGGETGRNGLIALSGSPYTGVRQQALLALERCGREKPLLEIRCFGRFSLLLGNRPVEESYWQTKQAKHLFILLALNAGKSFSEDRLMAAFWPDSPQDKAKQNLLTTVTRVRNVFRKQFGDLETEDYIIKDQEFLKFNIETNYWHDVQAFELHIDEARASLARGDERKALAAYQHAQRIHTGMLLEGIYEDWCSVRREETEEKQLEALAQLSHYYLEHGNGEASMAYARRILDDDRHSSRGMSLFMRASLKQGNRDMALKKYYEYVKSLEKEQGIPPDPEVLKLYLQIKEGSPPQPEALPREGP